MTWELIRAGTDTQKFARIPYVAGKDTGDCGCSTFVFHGATHMRKPATNLRAMGIDIARADRRRVWESAVNSLVTCSGISDSTVDAIPVGRTQCSTEIGGWATFRSCYVADIWPEK